MHGVMGTMPMGMWWKSPHVVERIGLTAEQQKKMDGIFQESRIKLIDLKAAVEKQEVLLQPMLDANPVDTRRALVQIGKVADARAALEKANAGMLLELRGVLTPEQWTKLHGDDGHAKGAEGVHHHSGMAKGPMGAGGAPQP
jgi:Spy/CpxP family protein refolding chaperone